jgi:hypothetical protein
MSNKISSDIEPPSDPALASCAGYASFSRVWSMPKADTFDIPPIAGFVRRYLMRSKISVDPFSRNKRWATYTNDLNPNTCADSHMDAADFLKMLAAKGVRPDLIILDPPYGARQIVDCYAAMGLDAATVEAVKARKPTQNVSFSDAKDAAAAMQDPGGIVLKFGWNSNGMSKSRGYEMLEVILVHHGGGRNDTICTAEMKRPELQETLL